MKITKKINNRKKTLLISAATLLILIISASIYVFAYGGNLFGWKISTDSPNKAGSSLESSNKTPEVTTPSTSDQIDTGTTIKKNSLDSTDNSTSDKIDISISSVKNGPYLRISSILQVITNTGTCTLSLSKGEQTITKLADVQAQSSYSTCKGFDIPLDSLSSGIWEVKVSFNNSEHYGESSTSTKVD